MHSVPFQLSERFAYLTTPRSQGVRISEGPLYIVFNLSILISNANSENEPTHHSSFVCVLSAPELCI